MLIVNRYNMNCTYKQQNVKLFRFLITFLPCFLNNWVFSARFRVCDFKKVSTIKTGFLGPTRLKFLSANRRITKHNKIIYQIIPQIKVKLIGKNRKKIAEKIQLYLITAAFPKNSQSFVPYRRPLAVPYRHPSLYPIDTPSLNLMTLPPVLFIIYDLKFILYLLFKL